MKRKFYVPFLLMLVFLCNVASAQVISTTTTPFDFGTGSAASNAAGFQTDNMVVSSNVSMPAGVYNFVSFTINAGVTVTVTGAVPLIIKCTGACTISGVLTGAGGAGGSGAAFGAAAGGGGGGAAGGPANDGGGSLGVVGANGSSFPGTTGRGKGGVQNGFCGFGACYAVSGAATNPNAACLTGSNNGVAYGNAALTINLNSTNILGGSGGGAGSGSGTGNGGIAPSGGGGGGGGGIAIIANSIEITTGTGLVTVKGGAGGDPGNNLGGTGGGGSGGTVLLQSATQPTGTLTVNSSSATTATNGIDISGGRGGSSNDASLIGGPGSYGYYLLQVTCSGTPSPGSISASPSSVCAATTGAPAGAVLSIASAIGYSYQWQVSGTSGSGYANVASGGTSSSYTTPTTLPNTPTSYYICNVTCANGGGTGSSSELAVGYNSTLNCYCKPTYSTGPGTADVITSVSLNADANPISNYNVGQLASPYYTVITSPVPNMTKGNSYTVSMKAGTNVNSTFAVWIDFDGDGVFNSTANGNSSSSGGEFIGSVASGNHTSTAGTLTFTVLSGAVTGTNVLMRIVERRTTAATATQSCNAFTQGEAADFYVSFAGGCSAPATAATLQGTPYANVTTGGGDINFTRGNGTGGVMIVASTGTPATPVNGSSYSTGTFAYGSQLLTGSTYIVYNGTANGTGANYTTSVTGLTNFTAYNFKIFEYNGSASAPCFISGGTSASFQTLDFAMAYVSSTTTQNTGKALLGATNVQVVGLQVVTQYTVSPLALTQINLTTAGSTSDADISKARIYYTGTTGTYSPINQFGSDVTNPSGAFTFDGSRTLSAGTNYFWLVYDVSATATIEDVLDAQSVSIIVAGNSQTPGVTSPAGNVLIEYCTLTSSRVSCASGSGTSYVGIKSVGIDGSGTNLLNLASCSGVAYTNNYTTVYNVIAGSTYTFNVGLFTPTNTFSNLGCVGVYGLADWDNSGAFLDGANSPNEQFYFDGPCSSPGTTYAPTVGTYTVTIPTGIPTGLHRIRIIEAQNPTATSACSVTPGNPGAGQAFDFDLNVSAVTPMLYSSSTTTQNTQTAQLNTTNNQVIGLQVVTTGSTSPLTMTQINCNTTGSTNAAVDISKAKIYYTGTVNTFATTSQYGADVLNPNGDFSVSGTQQLASGTNYFWIVYDVPSGATIGDVADAQCPSFVIDGNTYNPSVTSPAGNMPIEYCPFTSTIATCSTSAGHQYCGISTVGIDGSSNNLLSLGSCSSTAYTNNSGSSSYSVAAGNVYQFSTTIFTPTASISSLGQVGFYALVDWNNSGYFQDGTNNPAEQIFSSVLSSSSATTTTITGTITIPSGASLGNHRMRVIMAQNNTPGVCGATGAGQAFDFTLNVTSAVPMVYTSSTTTQNVGSILQNTSNNMIIGLQVVATGSTSPLSMTQIVGNTNGCTNAGVDLTNAKIYYTGTSSTFSATGQFGSTISSPNGSFTANGTQQLSPGTNYFWITYDVPSGAIGGDLVDAECSSFTAGGTTYSPSPTAPSGNSAIQVNYGSCAAPLAGSPCFFGLYSFYITQVSFGTLSFTGGTCTEMGSSNSPDSYKDFYSTVSGSVTQGNTYTFNMRRSGSSGGGFFSAWCDWNNNGSFTDAGEQLFTVAGAVGATNQNFTVTVPLTATVGPHRLRVRVDGSDPAGSPNPCAYTGPYGESNDFLLNVNVCVPPTLTITPGGSTTICKGSSVLLTASGATNYNWAPADKVDYSNTAAVNTTATVTTTYTVTSTGTGGCSSTATVTVTVNPGVIGFTPSAPSIASGGNVSITASAASTNGDVSFSWSPSTALDVTTGATVISNPLSNTTYTVTGTDGICSGTGTITVVVNNTGTPGQVSCGYAWSKSNPNNITLLSNPTILASGVNSTTNDAIYTNQPIGFPFDFNGITYSTVGVSSNGFIWFGSNNPAATEYNPISTSTSLEGVVSVFGANLAGALTSGSCQGYTSGTVGDGNTTLSIQTSGVTPDRTFTVQWHSFASVASGSTCDMGDYQVVLKESNYGIDFKYGNYNYYIDDIFTGQVGIRGASNTDFNTRRVLCNDGTNWDDLVNPKNNGSSAAGTSNTDVCTINGVNNCDLYPEPNLVWTWTPTVATPVITPTAQQSVCAGTGVTLTANTTMNSPSYQWMTYTYPPNNTFVNGQTNPAFLANPSSAGTYYYAVRVTDGSGCSRTSAAEAVVASSCGYTLTTTFFLQGYYLGGTMSPLLYMIDPAHHAATDVDTVTVEFHNPSSPYGLAAFYTGILQTNGTVSGSMNLSGTYYIVVKHRNSITTWSASAVSVNASNNTYNFSSGAAQALGSNMVNLGGGVYGIYSGDVNLSGAIDGTDKTAMQSLLSTFTIGVYNANDITGDGFVDEDDYRILQNNIPMGISEHHP